MTLWQGILAASNNRVIARDRVIAVIGKPRGAIVVGGKPVLILRL